MRHLLIVFAFTFILAAFAKPAAAEMQVHRIFDHNIGMQRNQSVKVRGGADAMPGVSVQSGKQRKETCKAQLFVAALQTTDKPEVKLERKYVKGAELTEEQEATVSRLALACGVKKVARIETFYLRPTADKGIRIVGPETIEGRDVSYQVLSANHEPWTSQTPRKGNIVLEDFWAGKPYIKKQTILKVEKAEYRIQRCSKSQAVAYEAILTKLIGKKYKLGDNVDRDWFEKIDFTKPHFISGQMDSFTASFGGIEDQSESFEVTIKTEEDEVIITELLIAVQ